MKKRIYLVAATFIITFSVFNNRARAAGTLNKDVIAAMTTAQKQARIEEIKQRVDEIRAMDKSQLSKAERKALRAVLKNDKREARAMDGRTYLSIGAIVVVILLLILLL